MHPNNFDIIEDEPLPYPEKPKRKGKPINWREAADWAVFIIGFILIAALVIALAAFFKTGMDRLYRTVFPDGMPAIPEEFSAVIQCMVIPAAISTTVTLISYIVKKLK